MVYAAVPVYLYVFTLGLPFQLQISAIGRTRGVQRVSLQRHYIVLFLRVCD